MSLISGREESNILRGVSISLDIGSSITSVSVSMSSADASKSGEGGYRHRTVETRQMVTMITF